MNNDTRLAVSAHILALLSLLQKEYQTSECIARSVNTNAVVIRRLIGQMKKAGLVEVRPGIGGATLNRPPEKITLLDVFDAVVPKAKASPFYLHAAPNRQCFVGRNIHAALEDPFIKVSRAMRESLAATTVADIAAHIQTEMNGNA